MARENHGTLAVLTRAWLSAFLPSTGFAIADTAVVASRGQVPVATYFLQNLAVVAWLTLCLAGTFCALRGVLLRSFKSRVSIGHGVAWGALASVVCLFLLQFWHLSRDPLHLKWTVPAVGLMLGAGAAYGIRFPFWRYLICATFACAAVCAFLADAYLFRRLYGTLHDVAAFLALLFGMISVWLAVPKLGSGRLKWVVLALALGAQAALFVSEQDAARVAGHRNGVLLPKYLALVHVFTDFDGDGRSGFFGGGDCDDTNERIHPGACEVADNGLDDNCNGAIDKTSSVSTTQAGQKLVLRSPLPDVYFILVDALRVEIDKKTPPFGTTLAKSAWRFEHAYSPFPATRWAIASIMTGRFFRYVSKAQPIFTDLLKAHGYESQYWIRDEKLPISDQSFLWGIPAKGDPIFVPSTPEKLTWTRKILQGTLKEAHQEGPPRFRWLHLLDPHRPLLRGEGTPIQKYRAETAFVARELDEFFTAVLESPRLREAVFVVFSDHGEEFGEHGGAFHGATLYEESVHVPLQILFPGMESKTFSGAASLVDIAPTLFEFLGMPPSPSWQGWNWTRSPWPEQAARVVAQNGVMLTWAGMDLPEAQLVTDGTHKLIANVDLNYEEFYDLKRDPREQRPDAVFEEARNALRKALADWQDLNVCQ